jgi:hypothetical protein
MTNLTPHTFYDFWDVANEVFPENERMDIWDRDCFDVFYEYLTAGAYTDIRSILGYTDCEMILDTWEDAEAYNEFENDNTDFYVYLNTFAEWLDDNFGHGEGVDRWYDISVNCY